MYRQHLYVKNIKGIEKVFSKVIIPAKKPILYLTGNIFSATTIKKIEDIVQIGPKKYLGLSGGIDDKIRHSCNPTTYLNMIGDKAILYSIHDIKPNIEITYDLSVSLLNNNLHLPCYCESLNCRKIITDFQALPIHIKDKYFNLNIIPIYIKYNFFKTD